jgi:hypothetical protein
MDVLIDNKNLEDYGITVLDYTGALSFPAERENEREWQDKSGVDKNLENIRFDPKEFVLQCLVKADTEGAAYNLIKTLVNDLFERGCVVLSLRDSERSIRECYLVERSSTLTGNIKVREQNSLYLFKLGLKDVNPNAVKYKTTIVGNSVTITYTKGQTAVIYWGDGSRGQVSNSGDYTKNDYSADGPVDIIIDVDQDSEDVTNLSAEFSADVLSGIKKQTVNFTNESTGDIGIWNWDFGDGNTSDEKNPTHIYEQAGTFTVSLQIFNSANGSDVETKVDYITVRDARLMINEVDSLLINSTDKLLKN